MIDSLAGTDDERTSGGEERVTVLVADDDLSVRRLVELSFRLQGFEVLSAADGEEALHLARQHRPQAAVLDVTMPKLDGLEVCRRLRGEPDWQPAIVMLTGRVQLTERLAGFDCGADDYVVKPVKLLDLVERVKSRIAHHHPAGVPDPLVGWSELQREIERRLVAGDDVAVVHVDLHQFRGYNERYGFGRGDQVLHWVTRLLLGSCSGDPTALVGRLGADDFLVVTTGDYVPALTSALLPAFDAGIARFYDAEDAERGWVEVVDRRGGLHRHRLLALAVGVSLSRLRPVGHPRELVETAAEMGRYARTQQGSALATDRRR